MITAIPLIFSVLSITVPLSAHGRIVKPAMIALFVRMVIFPLVATLFWFADAFYTLATSEDITGGISGTISNFPSWPVGVFFGVLGVIFGLYTFAMMLTEGLAMLRDEDIFEAQATGEARGPYE